MDQRAVNAIARLPELTRSKLQQLELARMAAEDAGRAANARLNSLGRDAAPELVRGLAAERDKHAERHRSFSLLVGA
jgi:hypothetical protein